MTGYSSDGGCVNGALAPLLSEAVHFKRYATKFSGKWDENCSHDSLQPRDLLLHIVDGRPTDGRRIFAAD